MTTKTKILISILLWVMLIGINGCDRGSDAVVVDFSKTVAVDRPISSVPESAQLRVAVAAIISPKETFAYYRQLLDYIGQKLGREIQFIQRKTYGEINELLAKGQIDMAFICSGPYVVGKEKHGFELLATPEVQNSHFYHSYLIVNKNSSLQTLADLRGQVFAFTDPDSNTGKLVPTYWLSLMNERPETFFSKTIYTYSHDNAILAVAKGLVDGAAVDGLIWEYYHRKNPVFTSETRIIRKSEQYGIPPLVASKSLSFEIKTRVRQELFDMHQDPNGKKIISELMIDRFVNPRDEWYDSIRNMNLKLASLEKESNAATQP
ncbi:MAG: phosphate/phosphite/phosphonate ABC transporter substrate-binding protein [Desulfobacterales bacterium]|jgi:phosphonate transport system substrate-binding protein|nr:MAG: phosphate/phosphite/phosphonate ABC transporter substrate-binding protein [Desulfobacterales bacterium]